MVGARKDHVIATALSPDIYNKLIYITGEKKLSISEAVIMSVATKLSTPGVEIQKTKRTSEHKKVITVRVSEGLSRIVDEAAKQLGCSKSKYLSVALNEGLNYVNKG